MVKILQALRDSVKLTPWGRYEYRPLRLIDIIRRCEGLPEKYYYIPRVGRSVVWLLKCPNLETSFASYQPDFQGQSVGWPFSTPWDKEVRKLYVSYHRSVRRLCEHGLILDWWETGRPRYTITEEGIKLLNVKKSVKLPDEKPPQLKVLCSNCFSRKSEVVYLKPCDTPRGWRCPRCGFTLPLEEPHAIKPAF